MRFFLLLLILLTLAYSGFSQNQNLGISFGWGIGEHIWTNNAEKAAILGFGFNYNLGIKERIVLSPYLGYSVKSSYIHHDPLHPTIGDISTYVCYISNYYLMKYYIPINWIKLFIGIGPRVDFQIGARDIYSYPEDDSRNSSTFNKIIWGINSDIGISFRIYDRLNMNVAVENEYDLRPINKPELTSSSYNYKKIKNNFFILKLGLSWKIKPSTSTKS